MPQKSGVVTALAGDAGGISTSPREVNAMELKGFEPSFSRCKRDVFPLDDSPCPQIPLQDR